MPPLPVVPSTLKIELEWNTSSLTRAGCRSFYSYTGSAPSGASATAIASDVAAAYAAHLLAELNDDMALTGVKVTDLATDTGAVGEWSGSHGGTAAAGPPTGETCILINFEIARRYRGGKPKIFLPPAGTDSLDSSFSHWTSGAVTGFNTAWTDYDTAVLAIAESGTSLSNHVNVSYYQGFTTVLNPITGRTRDVPKLRTGGPVVDVITGHSASNVISQQRRRRTSTSV